MREEIEAIEPPQRTLRCELDRALSAGDFPIEKVISELQAGGSLVEVVGLQGAATSILLRKLADLTQRPLLVIGATPKRLDALKADLLSFGGDTPLLIPTLDTSPYSGLTPNRGKVSERLAQAFSLLMGDAPSITLTSIQALQRKLPPIDLLESLSEVITVGSEIDLSDFKQRLVAAGYTPVKQVEDSGTFAIRGGIVDVYSPASAQPIRVELWGDEVETLRTFDPVTQRSTGETDGFFVCPVREEIFTDDTLSMAKRRLREVADQLGLPTKSLRKVLTDLGHGLHFLGIEALTPAFYQRLDPFSSILPEAPIVVILDPDATLETAEETYRKALEEHQMRLKEELFSFSPNEFYLTPEELSTWLHKHQRLSLDPLERSPDAPPIKINCIDNLDLVHARGQRGAGEGAIKAVVEKLKEWREVYGEIAFTCHATGQRERLSTILRAFGQKTEVLDQPIDLSTSRRPPASTLKIYPGALNSGARLPALGLAVISEEELFGPRVRRRSTRKDRARAAAVQSFKELKVGDHLVHVEHGIGRYLGLVKLEVNGVPADFIQIAYSGDDKLYLPIYRLGAVQKHSGDTPRKIDKLGGVAWERTKERIKEDVKKLAIDLIKLYAERQARPGYAFSEPDEYFKEFEASFPFDETPDQASAIEDVLDDMVTARPMDRLVCGDVGFGKTEVAMRAAFKAVLDGRQVAVLVPTTILAEQHLSSFRTRFSGYPVRIEALSRFRKARQTKEILKDLESGRVDILIGTHRLLSKDIGFKRLGLLIVDEEHRFGVAHKEKIKEISTSVDVLTMTATPIPRTLQMSLFGMRDLSIIATPPQDRLAVRTYVAKYKDLLVRDAIMSELGRGGQVYLLYNRVQTIDAFAGRLRELVPEARISVGHGQMDERKLERVMVDFIRGETNVLISTTIIESGLDIPNANCMIIHRADTFGLAQLYQLRGRIGRSSQRAHCYLLVPDNAAITQDARDRLDAIERLSELGSGLEIAHFDLELRGAGNLLGAEQSGNIAAVGLDLYAELLDEAIAEVQGDWHQTEIEPEVNLPVESHIPDDYLPDIQLRLLFYKRLSNAMDQRQLFEIFGEIVDRFGPAPKQVKNLLQVFELKILVKRLRCLAIDANHTALVLNIGEGSLLDPNKVVQLVTRDPRRYQLRTDLRLVRYLTKKESETLFDTARAHLDDLAKTCSLSK